MSVWRDIWQKALEVNKEMLFNNDCISSKYFSKLYAKYGTDGMICFVEGEAYEYLDKFEDAKKCYENAKKNFPVEHWQKRAQEAIDRIELKKMGFDWQRKSVSSQWQMFHKMHTYFNLPNQIRYTAISAIARIDSEAPVAAGTFRMCMEEMIRSYLCSDPKLENLRLAEIIDELELPSEIKKEMRYIKKVGDKALHRGYVIDKEKLLRSFDIVMEFINDEFRGVWID